MRTSPQASGFEQLRAQTVRSFTPDVGQRDVTIGQLLRIHAEQRRTAARMKMHADDMHIAACIEHEIFRLRAMDDSAVENHPDVVGGILEYPQVVGREIERKIDAAGRERALALPIRVAAVRVPELVDERRQRRCGPIAEHLHDEVHRKVEAAS